MNAYCAAIAMNEAKRLGWPAGVVACCGLLAGCAGSTKPELADVYVKSLESERRGFKAAKSGDHAKSLLYYQQALRFRRSVEDIDGIAIDLVNLAVLYQRLGSEADARALIAEVFGLPGVNDSVLSEAAYENAKLYLKDNDFVKARIWGNKSLSLDKNKRVASRFNLLGRIAFMEGNNEEALQWANSALESNQEDLQKAEQANSLRLIAMVNVQKGNDAEAMEYYSQALRLDKEAGESAKIALDLLELGKLSLKAGNSEEAQMFFHRADQVRKSAGNDKNAAQ